MVSAHHTSKLYLRYKYPSPPRGGWFSDGDMRFALVLATFYRMMLTHPVMLLKFHHIWHAVRIESAWRAMFATLTYPLYPIYLYFRILLKSISDLHRAGPCPARPTGTEDNASVFFALPDTLFARVHAEFYFELSYRIGNFMQLGADPVAIQHSNMDVVTTKEYWFGLLDSTTGVRTHSV